MGLRHLFLFLVLFVLALNGAFLYLIIYGITTPRVILVEGLILLTFFFLFYFYRRTIRPLDAIGNGMDLLKEQDFSSRLKKTGQKETDRIVDLFNKIMIQLKNERLRSEERNHFLELLIQASPMGVIIMDLDERILSLNPAVSRFLNGRDKAELIGRKLMACDEPLLEGLLHIPLENSETIRMSDARISKCTASYLMDRGFQRRFFLIEELTREMFKVERKAYEKVIRMISHEVNNTTAGITSTLDTLQSAFDDECEENQDIREALRVTIDRCYGMSRFITNFADVVRLPEPMLRPVSLNNCVLSCERLMETICVERRIEVRMDLADDLPPVPLDTPLFEQALLNIIKNAVEAIGEKGIIFIRTQDNPVRLEVADTGKGISKEVEGKLFSPFFSTKPNGQGIGLMLIREILQKHHCYFSLTTGKDGLTRFVIQWNSLDMAHL